MRGGRRTTSWGARAAVAALAAGVAAAVLGWATDGRAGFVLAERAGAGSPARGRTAFLAKGCSGCHLLAAPSSRTPVGPELTPDLLRADARSAGKPVGAFVVDSLLLPNLYVSPGYTSNVMPPTRGLTRQELEDIVSFLIGAPYTSPAAGQVVLPKQPVAACRQDAACEATVARWAATQRLPRSLLDGARIVAKVGCLSCHRYAGAGIRSGAAPALTEIGRTRPSRASLLRQLRCPTCVTRGSVMPSYAALGSANLQRVVEFLRASRGGVR